MKVLTVKIEAHNGEMFAVRGDNAAVIVNENSKSLVCIANALRKVAAQATIEVERNGHGKPFVWVGSYKNLVCN